MASPIAPALLQHVSPRRSIPGSAKLPPYAAFEKWLGKVWGTKGAYYLKRTWGQAFDAGAKTALRGVLKAQHVEAMALLRGISLAAIKKAKLETLAVAECIVGEMAHGRTAASPFRSLTPFIASERGAADAVKVWLRSHELCVRDHDRGKETWALVAAEATHPKLEKNTELRAAIAAADDASYAEARAVAAKARKQQKTLMGRARIAFHFPDEPWATEDLEARIGDPSLGKEHLYLGFLLTATSDLGVVKRYLEIDGHADDASEAAFDLAAVLPEEAALPLLASSITALLKKPSYGPVLKGAPRHVASAVAAIGTSSAAAVLARFASHPILAPQILEWFRAHPEHTGALESSAKDGSKLAAAAQRIASKQKGGGAAGRVATAEELPAFLRDRPWKQTAKKSAPALELAMKGFELQRVDAELLASPAYTRLEREVRASRPMTRDELAKWRKEVEDREFTYADYDTIHKKGGGYEYAEVPPKEGLAAYTAEMWKGKKPYYVYLHEPEHVWFERHGVAAFPGWNRRDWSSSLQYGGEETLRTAMVIVSPGNAPTMATVFAFRKAFRRHARTWLLRNPLVAAYGLLPDALGGEGQRRKAAESALALLAANGHRAEVERAALAYGPEASLAASALLARDPLASDETVPKRPTFLKLQDLPAIQLRSSDATLGPDAVQSVLDMLSISLADDPYAGLERLRESCDEASLGAFALELLEQWVLADAPGRFDWMAYAVVHLPSDAGHARLAALAREWATKNQAKCERACIGLTAIGSDLALLHLTHIAQTTRFQNLKERAQILVKQAADARGLTVDELEDRTVPQPDPSDKKAHAAVVTRVTRRLERLMVTGRAIERATFDVFFAKHALVAPLARALVWETADGSTRVRVAEDSSFAGPRDEAVTLGADARLRLAHPARTPSLAAEWSTVFADYELIQPFEQIGRAVAAPTPKESKATALDRSKGAKVSAKKLMGLLEARGWRRSSAGAPSAFLRDEGEVTARLPISPGFEVIYLADAHPQKLEPITFTSRGRALKLSEVDAVVFAEVARDVDAAIATT